MEGVAIQLDDGRIGYIYGDTLLQAMSEDQDPLLNASSKFVCRFPNCEKSYSSVNHLKVTVILSLCPSFSFIMSSHLQGVKYTWVSLFTDYSLLVGTYVKMSFSYLKI